MQLLPNKDSKSAPRRLVAGFTLIELMIVIVIIAILAAIALPSYSKYIRESRRVDAKETLTRMATLQERFFFQNSRYSTSLADLGGATSPEGWYTIEIKQDGCSATACNNFTLTATAVGAQAQDTKCATFSIDQTLAQTATSNDCW